MRGIRTSISELRKNIFAEVAKVAYGEENINDAVEAIPYTVCPGDEPSYRESIYVERAIAAERVRLAMGMSLRPQDKPVHVTSGLEESNISEKYYEPPLMQVIPSACNMCDEKKYVVTNMCQGCVAHPCTEVCPKDAITKDIGGQSHIDPAKCIKCGKCKEACPYDAIIKQDRPCSTACGVGAIGTDAHGRAEIDPAKCVSCGQCMVSCPFGAIADKSQIFQLIRCIKEGQEVIAEVAPAYVGQFGDKASPKNIKEALKELGFADVIEVALGADIGAVAEAHHYVNHVATGELPFLLTSCCPAWSMLAKKQFPELIDSVSQELTPMVATARSIKKDKPNAKVVFVGPCAAKKLEASRKSVRSDVDFVLTFEELDAMFAAKGIDPNKVEGDSSLHDATAAGRGYACSGGVSRAIEECINEYYPGTEVKIEHAEGLAECKKMLLLAKAGKKDGFMIEGMGCPGGCIAGAGTILPIAKAQKEVKKMQDVSSKKIPSKDLVEVDLP